MQSFLLFFCEIISQLVLAIRHRYDKCQRREVWTVTADILTCYNKRRASAVWFINVSCISSQVHREPMLSLTPVLLLPSSLTHHSFPCLWLVGFFWHDKIERDKNYESSTAVSKVWGKSGLCNVMWRLAVRSFLAVSFFRVASECSSCDLTFSMNMRHKQKKKTYFILTQNPLIHQIYYLKNRAFLT